MKQTLMTCNPWDLLAEGVETALDRLAGDVGVSGIRVPATTPRVLEFRPRDGFHPRWFAAEAGAHFQPDPSRYVNTRLRPVPSPWLKTRNPLETVARLCQQRGFILRISAACCDAEAVVARYPFAACRDVFGRVSSRRLCPVNPDGREFAAALAEDLSAQFTPASIELAAAGFADDPAETRLGLSIGPIERFLLSLCLCESCGQAALGRGIEPASVARTIEVHLAPTLHAEAARTQSLDEFLAADAVLREYAAMQRDAVVELIQSVRRRTAAALVLRSENTLIPPSSDWRDIASRADAALLVPGNGPGAIQTSRCGGSSPNTDAARDESCFVCHPPVVTDGTELVRAVHEAVNAGCEMIVFETDGAAPQPCLDWVRQAIRYARREHASTT